MFCRFCIFANFALLVLLGFSAVCAQELDLDDDIWSIEPSGDIQSATLGKSQRATLRARLARPAELSADSKRKSSQLKQASIHWLVPEEEVEYYTLSYGTEDNKLDTQLRIKTSDLQQYEDKMHGRVYKYDLLVQLNDNFIFYTLKADNPNGRSSTSPVQKLLLK